jgi:molecular chaperone DnaK
MVSGNKSLGNFKLEGIPQAPKGQPQIEVTFDINVDGILSVTAKENESGKEQNVTIQGASNLSETEVNNMLEEAEKYAAIDKEQKENSELIVSATMACEQLEKTINEDSNEMNWTVEQKEEINMLLINLREAISLQKYAAIKEYLEQVKNFLSIEKG